MTHKTRQHNTSTRPTAPLGIAVGGCCQVKPPVPYQRPLRAKYRRSRASFGSPKINRAIPTITKETA